MQAKQISSTTTFGRKIADLGPMLKPLIFGYLWLAFIWAQICDADRNGRSIKEVLLFILFVGSLGFFIKIWFYVSAAVAFAEVLSEESDEVAPPDSATHYITGRLFEWGRALILFSMQMLLGVGSLFGVLAFVGYNTLWALGVTLLVGAIGYAFIEFHQKRAAFFQ